MHAILPILFFFCFFGTICIQNTNKYSYIIARYDYRIEQIQQHVSSASSSYERIIVYPEGRQPLYLILLYQVELFAVRPQSRLKVLTLLF